ncbi:MAG: SemiSWEET transporter [Chitinophagaceae bacterium]
MADTTTYIGIGAGVLTGISLVPQLVKIIREKKAEAISFPMLFTLMLGLAMWTWYGVRKEDLPIIITNSFSIITNFFIVGFSLKYKTKDK